MSCEHVQFGLQVRDAHTGEWAMLPERYETVGMEEGAQRAAEQAGVGRDVRIAGVISEHEEAEDVGEV